MRSRRRTEVSRLSLGLAIGDVTRGFRGPTAGNGGANFAKIVGEVGAEVGLSNREPRGGSEFGSGEWG